MPGILGVAGELRHLRIEIERSEGDCVIVIGRRDVIQISGGVGVLVLGTLGDPVREGAARALGGAALVVGVVAVVARSAGGVARVQDVVAVGVLGRCDDLLEGAKALEGDRDAEVVREGGLKVPIIMRFSAIPGHRAPQPFS